MKKGRLQFPISLDLDKKVHDPSRMTYNIYVNLDRCQGEGTVDTTRSCETILWARRVAPLHTIKSGGLQMILRVRRRPHWFRHIFCSAETQSLIKFEAHWTVVQHAWARAFMLPRMNIHFPRFFSTMKNINFWYDELPSTNDVFFLWQSVSFFRGVVLTHIVLSSQGSGVNYLYVKLTGPTKKRQRSLSFTLHHLGSDFLRHFHNLDFVEQRQFCRVQAESSWGKWKKKNSNCDMCRSVQPWSSRICVSSQEIRRKLP